VCVCVCVCVCVRVSERERERERVLAIDLLSFHILGFWVMTSCSDVPPSLGS
jgi:multisubunit Na+/H+ antiporter MnhF subunit